MTFFINSLKNTAQLGKGDWAVIEADESDGSFLKLPITYSIVTNLDKEHLDYYGSFENLKKSFYNFIEKTPSFGKSLVCIDNKNLNSFNNKSWRNLIGYVTQDQFFFNESIYFNSMFSIINKNFPTIPMRSTNN